MNKLVVESWALVFLFASFPLISLGTTYDRASLEVLGLASLLVGALLPVVTRFTARQDIPDKPRDVGMEFDERTS